MQTSNKNITLAKIVGESELVSVNLTSPSHSLPAHYPSRQQEEILDQLEDRFQERVSSSHLMLPVSDSSQLYLY